MIWKDVIGYEGLYQVSEYGDIKSLSRKTQRVLKQGLCEITFKEKLMKVNKITKKTRYKMIKLSRRDNTNTNYYKLIHHIVYEAFVAKIDETKVIDHIDNDRNNNHFTNLQQITQRENITKYFKNKSENSVVDGYKRCSCCLVNKSVSDFYLKAKKSRRDWSSDNWRAKCKKCVELTKKNKLSYELQ